MTYVQMCLLANLPPDVSADLPDIFYVFFLQWSCATRGVALEFQGLSKIFLSLTR